jgi:DNA-binding NarL/FixJ family response regulator
VVEGVANAKVILEKKKVRVLVADDQAMVAAGICKLLDSYCEVVGVVGDGRALLENAEHLHPEIVVMEVALLLLNGLDAARHLTKMVPECKIVFLTSQTGSRHIAEAFNAGASAYLLKHSPPSELRQAIHAVMEGQQYLSPLITRQALTSGVSCSRKEVGRASASSLTQRQREVLQLIAEGRGTKEVATLLNIAVKTVEYHKFRIMDQLDLHSTVALTKHALAEGLISL